MTEQPGNSITAEERARRINAVNALRLRAAQAANLLDIKERIEVTPEYVATTAAILLRMEKPTLRTRISRLFARLWGKYVAWKTLHDFRNHYPIVPMESDSTEWHDTYDSPKMESVAAKMLEK